MGVMRRKMPDEDDLKDGIEFDNFGRMKYHPDFHPNHGKALKEEELEYLCKFYDVDDSRTMAFALGKTEQTIMSKICDLKKTGRFEYYKNLNRYW